MADFDSNFARALESKLRNQDAASASAATNAAANMMGAQTQRGLADSEAFARYGQTNAALTTAGTGRLNTAAQNPMGFSANQVNTMGLRNFGVSPSAPATAFSQDMYGTGGSSPYALLMKDAIKQYGLPGTTQSVAAPALAPPPGTLTPGNTPDAFRKNNLFGAARGGVIGNVKHDTGKDTLKAKVRPGEYMINPETVAKGFGGGSYEKGLRNLNDIVRKATGKEPGATFSKKGKAGYAPGGVVEPRRRRTPPSIPNPAAVLAAHPLVPSEPSPYLAEVAGKPALAPSNDVLTNSLFGDQTPAPVASAPVAANMRGLMGKLMQPPAAPSTQAIANTAPPPTPTLKNMAQQAVAQNASALPPVPLITENSKNFAIRDAVQGGGRPGSQISFNYGAGHGMEAGAAPIVATADKTGKYNMFGNMGLRHGGVVPGFQESGVVKPGFFPVPAGPLQDVTDVGARAQLAQDRWDKRWTAGLEAKAAADAEAKAAEEAAKAGARASGQDVKDAAKRLLSQKYELKDVASKAYEGVKSVLPSKETLGTGARWAGKIGGPIAAAAGAVDIADVYTDPKMHGSDVITEIGDKGLRWLGGAAGGIGGGLVGGPVGALAGAVGGYNLAGYGAGKLRGLLGTDEAPPSERSHGFFKKGDEVVPTAAAPAATPQAAAPAAPAGPPKPSLRDIMMLRALALGGGGPGADSEQKNLLNYLGQVDANAGRGDAAALNASREHEKEMEASLRSRFQKTVKDPKTGKEEKADDLAAYERFSADMATRGVPIFNVSRSDRDRLLAEWQARDRTGQRIRAKQTEVGDPGSYVSDRVPNIGLKSGLTVGDWWGSKNIGVGDLAKSFTGTGLRNQVAMVPVYDPVSRQTVMQKFPAATAFGGGDEPIDYDALRYSVKGK